MKTIKNIHPGEILDKEFLIPMSITAYRLAKETRIPQGRVSDIIHRKRRITADTALRFSKFLETPLSFGWGFKMITILKKKQKKYLKN